MKKILVLSSLMIFSAQAQYVRKNITIVGSSTVYPFASLVAERFGQTTEFLTPTIEATGSGGGIKLFCSGIGSSFPDITNSSRPIKQSEIDQCKKNGIDEITEVRFGYDGIVLANSKKAHHFNLTTKQIWLSLSAQVPDKEGKKLISNPYLFWSDIDPSLPKQKIEVLGPPPTSGTRDAFVELAMHSGCKDFPVVKKLDKKLKNAVCSAIRSDGAYIEAGENDNLIVNRLASDPVLLGIFGYSFLEENEDKVQASKINNFSATFDNIAQNNYPLSRPLYFYVKNAHLSLIGGLKEFVQDFVSDDAIGEDGYLIYAGLVNLNLDQLRKLQNKINQLK